MAANPSLAEKVANFAASAARHVAAGMPQATEEQVAERFAICQGCEHFDGTACRKCGCPVVREKKFLSKLSWAGESCPVGKWGPVSGQNSESPKTA
jgi:ribosomal protein L40E